MFSFYSNRVVLPAWPRIRLVFRRCSMSLPGNVPWLRVTPFFLLQAVCLLVFVVGWSPITRASVKSGG